MQLFWAYTRGRIDYAKSFIGELSKDVVTVADTIVRKVKYYAGGEKGERIWHNYLSFKSHLHS